MLLSQFLHLRFLRFAHGLQSLVLGSSKLLQCRVLRAFERLQFLVALGLNFVFQGFEIAIQEVGCYGFDDESNGSQEDGGTTQKFQDFGPIHRETPAKKWAVCETNGPEFDCEVAVFLSSR